MLLGAVCVMTLLSNLLATVASGLFFKATKEFVREVKFTPPFQPLFVPIDPSSGPPLGTRPVSSSTRHSGAYQGEVGEEHFLITETNGTGTSLLPWIGNGVMYLPFAKAEDLSLGSQNKANTHYFRGTPDCKPARSDRDYFLRFWGSEDIRDSERFGLLALFNVTLTGSNGQQISCYAPSNAADSFANDSAVYNESSFPDNRSQNISGRMAGEISTTLVPGSNATDEEQRMCRSTVAVAWLRSNGQAQPSDTGPAGNSQRWNEADDNNAFLMLCRPRLLRGFAEVLVNDQGSILRDIGMAQPESDLEEYTESGVGDLMSQSNLFIFRSLLSSWHHDSYANEYVQHFTKRGFTDPHTPLPKFEEVEISIQHAYARLFAAWLGVNRERLFVPATDTKQIDGLSMTTEERIFFRAPLFIITEVILATYVLVSLMLYWRRPGRYLARTPTSIAALIALFASSAAVKDLRGTLHMKNDERAMYLAQLDCRYGYGSYIGSDGAVHVGIEKVPYVRYIKDVTFKGSRAEQELRKRQGCKDNIVLKQGDKV
jgi:hypothetical protein